jgi:hypothetical protein
MAVRHRNRPNLMPDTPELIAARKKALELNKNIRTAPPITPRTGAQNTLGTILKDTGATIKYSDSGNGGAILVNPGPNMNGVGAAIKIESLPSVVNAQKCGQLMESFFKNATGTPPSRRQGRRFMGLMNSRRTARWAPA